MFGGAIPSCELAGALELDAVTLPVVEGEREDFEALFAGDQQAGRRIEPARQEDDRPPHRPGTSPQRIL